MYIGARSGGAVSWKNISRQWFANKNLNKLLLLRCPAEKLHKVPPGFLEKFPVILIAASAIRSYPVLNRYLRECAKSKTKVFLLGIPYHFKSKNIHVLYPFKGNMKDFIKIDFFIHMREKKDKQFLKYKKPRLTILTQKEGRIYFETGGFGPVLLRHNYSPDWKAFDSKNSELLIMEAAPSFFITFASGKTRVVFVPPYWERWLNYISLFTIIIVSIYGIRLRRRELRGEKK